jgi:hypothetical protein
MEVQQTFNMRLLQMLFAGVSTNVYTTIHCMLYRAEAAPGMNSDNTYSDTICVARDHQHKRSSEYCCPTCVTYVRWQPQDATPTPGCHQNTIRYIRSAMLQLTEFLSYRSQITYGCLDACTKQN